MERNLAILKKQSVETWLNRKPKKQEVFSHFGEQWSKSCLFVCFLQFLWGLKTSDGGLGFVGAGFLWVFGESRRERKSSTYCSQRERKFDTYYCVPRSRICEKTRLQSLVFFGFFFFRVYWSMFWESAKVVGAEQSKKWGWRFGLRGIRELLTYSPVEKPAGNFGWVTCCGRGCFGERWLGIKFGSQLGQECSAHKTKFSHNLDKRCFAHKTKFSRNLDKAASQVEIELQLGQGCSTIQLIRQLSL